MLARDCDGGSGGGGGWMMLMVTDAEWDQIYPGSQSLNDASLPSGLQDYLTRRYDGLDGL